MRRSPATLPALSAEVEIGIQGSGQWAEGRFDPGHFRTVAQAAEQLGYDAIWAGDHISFENPILDPFCALATFAAVTERIALGTGVVLLPLRAPALVAKQAASLDYLSGGRLLLGVGGGGEGEKDFEAAGVARSERGARTTEGIRVLRTLLGGGPASFDGRFSHFTDVAIEPPPVRPGGPPILVGGRVEAVLERTGRYADGWLAYMVSPERLAAGLETARSHAIAAGRDASAITAGVVLPTHVEADGERARAHLRAHLSRRYGRPFEPHQIARYTLSGSPDEAIERLREYVRAGATRIVFNPAGAADEFLADCAFLAAHVVAGYRTREEHAA